MFVTLATIVDKCLSRSENAAMVAKGTRMRRA